VCRGNHFSIITLQINTAIYGNVSGRVVMLKNTTCVAFNVCRLEVTRLQETEETVLKDSAERFIKLLDCATHL